MMKDYYPYHPQSHPQMAPYIANDDMADRLLVRRRPLPLPRSWRQRWRQRLSMLIGFIVVALAVATLFLDAPQNYLGGDVEPRRIVSPEQWEKLFSVPPVEETQTITEDAITEDAIEEEIADMSDQENAIAETSPPAAQTPPPVAPRAALPPVMTGYVVQITAARSYDVARRHYDRMRARHADLIGGLRFDIRRVDLGRRGVFHRLYLYPFDDQTGAQSLCRALKQRREECLVRKP